MDPRTKDDRVNGHTELETSEQELRLECIPCLIVRCPFKRNIETKEKTDALSIKVHFHLQLVFHNTECAQTMFYCSKFANGKLSRQLPFLLLNFCNIHGYVTIKMF